MTTLLIFCGIFSLILFGLKGTLVIMFIVMGFIVMGWWFLLVLLLILLLS